MFQHWYTISSTWGTISTTLDISNPHHLGETPCGYICGYILCSICGNFLLPVGNHLWSPGSLIKEKAGHRSPISLVTAKCTHFQLTGQFPPLQLKMYPHSSVTKPRALPVGTSVMVSTKCIHISIIHFLLAHISSS